MRTGAEISASDVEKYHFRKEKVWIVFLLTSCSVQLKNIHGTHHKKTRKKKNKLQQSVLLLACLTYTMNESEGTEGIIRGTITHSDTQTHSFWCHSMMSCHSLL